MYVIVERLRTVPERPVCRSVSKTKSDFFYNNIFTTIGEFAFRGYKNSDELVLPEGLQTIQDSAFDECDAKKIVIPDSVAEIGDLVFSGCSELEEIVVSENNDYYVSVAGALLNKDKTELISVPAGVGSFEIPDSVKEIKDYAFYNCSKLASIELPENLERIGEYVFVNCAELTEIEIPHSVEYIGNSAISSNNKLSKIIAPVRFMEQTNWVKYCPATISYYCLISYILDGELAGTETVDYGTDAEMLVPPANYVYNYYENQVEWNGKNIAADATVDIEKHRAKTVFSRLSAGKVTGGLEWEVALTTDSISGIDGMLYIVAYSDDDTIIAFKKEDVKTTLETEKISGTMLTATEPAYYKLFLWDKTNVFVPLCGNAKIEL